MRKLGVGLSTLTGILIVTILAVPAPEMAASTGGAPLEETAPQELLSSDFPEGTNWVLLNLSLPAGTARFRMHFGYDSRQLEEPEFRTQNVMLMVDGGRSVYFVRGGAIEVTSSHADVPTVTTGNPTDRGLDVFSSITYSTDEARNATIFIGISNPVRSDGLPALTMTLPDTTESWAIVASGMLESGTRVPDFERGTYISTPAIGYASGLSTTFTTTNSTLGYIGAYSDGTLEVELVGPSTEWRATSSPLNAGTLSSSFIQTREAGEWNINADVTGSQDYAIQWIFADPPAWATQLAIDNSA